jgi:non-specific serine/threonine protein kinase
MKVATVHLAPGDVLGTKYRIVEDLAKGGMGIIYKAEDVKLRRTVAIKLLPPELTRDPEARERFIHEARAASALDHANICTIYDIDETADGYMFIAMAYYPGETLKHRIERGHLRIKETVDIAVQIARGLARAHGAGITHRDIKPANIAITDYGEVRILDFGLAKLAGQQGITKAGITMGTVLYMSPEQARGEDVDHQTDIWSLGVVLYEMLAGQLPFRGDRDQTVIYSILNTEPQPLAAVRSDIPVALGRIVSKALQKPKRTRYQHIDKMLSDLTDLRTKLSTAATTEPVEVLAGVASAASPGAPKPIAVISFENQTGDKSYDYLQKAIPNLLITSLEQSKYLRVVTWERMYDLLKQLGKDDVDTIDRDLGFEACRMEEVDAVVVGSFVKAGDVFATDAKVLDVSTKEILKSVSSKGDGVDSILKNQIDELSREISTGLGIASSTTKARGLPIAEVATASMEAYEYFLKGREQYEKLYNDEAHQSLLKAIELDPKFAVAYLYLARTYDRLREVHKEHEAYEKAKAHSDKATEKERLYIEAAYARAIEQDEDKRFRTLKQITEKYPDEKRAHHFLAAHYRANGHLYQAVEEYKKVLDLDPNYGWAMNELAYMYADVWDFAKATDYLERYIAVSPGDANPLDSMGELYFRKGELDGAIEKYREAIEVKEDFYYAYWEIGYIYALKGEYDKAIEWTDGFIRWSPSPGTAAGGLLWKSFYYYWLGRLDLALAEAEKGRKLAEEAGSNLWKFEADRMKGWIYFDKGDTATSRKYFETCMCAVETDPSEYVPQATSYSMGLVQETSRLTSACSFALALMDLEDGRVDSARSILEEIRPVLPDYYGLLHGEVLLAEGTPDKAITVCEKAPAWKIPYMSDRDGMMAYNLPALKDTLARAFVRKGDTAKAIAEYERFITFDPQGKDRRFIHPLYHYRLATLHEETGDWARAIEQYRRFLDLWQEADPGFTEIEDARQSLARLQPSS